MNIIWWIVAVIVALFLAGLIVENLILGIVAFIVFLLIAWAISKRRGKKAAT